MRGWRSRTRKGGIVLLAKQRSRKPRPRAVRHPDAPLNRLRVEAGFTVPALAEIFQVSGASVSRWLSGVRHAPDEFIRFLARAAARDIGAYVDDAHRCRHPRPPVIEVELPPDVDPDRARRLCTAALAAALAEAQEGGSP